MYLVGNSFHVSFKWVVIISTKQEAAYTHTQSVKVSTCYTLWGLVTNNGEGGLQTAGGGGVSEVLPLQKKGGADFFLAVLKWGGGGGHNKL